MYVDMVAAGTVDNAALTTPDDRVGLLIFSAGQAPFYQTGPNLIREVKSNNAIPVRGPRGRAGSCRQVRRPRQGPDGHVGQGRHEVPQRVHRAGAVLHEPAHHDRASPSSRRSIRRRRRRSKTRTSAPTTDLIEDSVRPIAGETIATYADIVPTVPNKADVNAIVLECGREGPVRRRARPAGADRRRRRGQQAARLASCVPTSARLPFPHGGGPHTLARTDTSDLTAMTRKPRATPYLFLLPGARPARRLRVLPDRRGLLLQLHRLRHRPAAGLRRPRQLRSACSTTTRSGWRWCTHSSTCSSRRSSSSCRSCLAIVVNRKLRGIHIYRALYFVPAVSGSIAIGLSWRWLFDRSGFINSDAPVVGRHRRARSSGWRRPRWSCRSR